MTRRSTAIIVMGFVFSGGLSFARSAEQARRTVIQLVAQIQRADYQGDRAALQRLYGELGAFQEEKKLVARVSYWRGFALWRRALNGFNESAPADELEEDLKLAITQFKKSSAADPAFADAKIAEGSCLSNLIFLNRGNPKRVQELAARALPLLKQAQAEAPNNPRLYWVLGPNSWYAPADRGGGQMKAIELYRKGLQLADEGHGRSDDPLDPSWGKPELLMNLAWSALHQTTPDPQAAQSYARSALDLVPHWHYVKDIRMPQIQTLTTE
jgi:hypothetical protein